MIVVNLDLVIPAVILQEIINIKSLNNYQNNSKAYLSTMTITVDQVMNYAIRMRAWDLDRVIVNFDKNDVINYFQHNADLFEQVGHSSAYLIKFSETNDYDMENCVLSLIKNLSSKINYPIKVLKTVGLSKDIDNNETNKYHHDFDNMVRKTEPSTGRDIWCYPWE